MDKEILKRKGARSLAEIEPEVLVALNQGLIESANLIEWLAVDQMSLLKSVLKELSLETSLLSFESAIGNLTKSTVNTRNCVIGKTFLQIVDSDLDNKVFDFLKKHKSDAVRCWAAYMVGFNQSLSLPQTFKSIKDFADDSHFGVREIAWMAVRELIIKNLQQSLDVLQDWVVSDSASIRRFASEATRPRGVWCAQIQALKNNPALALPILEPLKMDSAKYVQDSVGNWLNDAGKSQPAWVVALCERWLNESNCLETRYIVKKAKRNLNN